MSSFTNSYAFPSNPIEIEPKLHPRPRPLFPMEAPPQDKLKTSLPDLPARSSGSFSSKYLVTTHVVPAAYPRLYTPATKESAYDLPRGATKEERIKHSKNIARLMQSKKWALIRGNGDSKSLLVDERENLEVVMFNVVNRYRRIPQPGDALSGRNTSGKGRQDGQRKGLTVVAAPGNGFHKEIWEPTFRHILEQCEDNAVTVDEIWSFEPVNHGDSALLNRSFLGDLFDVNEFPRDMMNFLAHYLPDYSPVDSELPKILNRLSDSTSQGRLQVGFDNRTVVGLGHSVGGFTAARIAAEYPSLWSSLVLVDPILYPPYPEEAVDLFIPMLMASAISRPSTWRSRDEATRQLQLNPYFAAWNTEALEAFVAYGLRDISDGVTLKTSGMQEAACYCNWQPPADAWYLLSTIPPRITLRWILAEDAGLMIGGDQIDHVVWRRPENASNIRLEGTTHLIPQEAPAALGEEVSRFLLAEYGTVISRDAKL